MVKIDILYEGDLHCSLTHGPSGAKISTDAPKDNHGKGEAFSPTDLIAAALGSCMLTTMGIYAGKQGINLKGAKAEVTKEMVQDPIRRIGRLTAHFHFPSGIAQEARAVLERVALACPVSKSLHGDVRIEVDFIYPD